MPWLPFVSVLGWPVTQYSCSDGVPGYAPVIALPVCSGNEDGGL